MAKAAPQD